MIEGLKNLFRSNKREFFLSLFVYSIVFVFLYRPSWSLKPFILSDEKDYFLFMEKILSVFFEVHPETFSHIGFRSPGASLIWLPGGFLGHVLSLIFPGDTIEWVWSVTALYSSALFGCSIYFILIFFKKHFSAISKKESNVIAISFLMNIPLIYYVIQRPMMTHTVEFFLASAALYFLFQNKYYVAVIFGVFLSLTRYQDVLFFLVFLGYMVDRSDVSFSRRKVIYLVLALSCAMISIPAFVTGYGGNRLMDIIPNINLDETIRFFLGSDWGVIWLIPLWICSFVLGILNIRKISWASRGSLLWMFALILLCIAWTGNGNDFGQRYLIGSFVASLVLWGDLAKLNNSLRKCFYLVSFLGASWMIFLNLVFKTASWTGHKNPEFMLSALRSFSEEGVYMSWIAQSSFVSLWNSWFGTSSDFYNLYIFSGPALWVFTLKFLLLFLFLIFFSINWFSRHNAFKN